MTVNDFIKELKLLPEDKKKKEIVIVAPNGIDFEPKIKYRFKDICDMTNFSTENIDKLVIEYD